MEDMGLYDATGRLNRSSMAGVPRPERKPTTGIESPAYRRNVFSGARRQEWDDWSRHVQMDSSLSRAEKKAFHDIFVAEGGMRRAPGGTAVAGILQTTLKMIRDDKYNRIPKIIEKHGPDVKTTQLDYEDIKEVYRGYFDTVLGSNAKDVFADQSRKGSKIISGLEDDEVSSAVADVIFRDGASSGVSHIQRSLMKYNPDLNIEHDRNLGRKTFYGIKSTIKDPVMRRNFLDGIADVRRKEERDRNDYFRFKD